MVLDLCSSYYFSLDFMVLDLLAFKVMSEDKVSFRVFIEKSELDRLVLFQKFLLQACSRNRESRVCTNNNWSGKCMQDAHAVCFLIAAATEA